MPQVKLLHKKNYLAMVRNTAQGENYMFCNLYAIVDDKEQDIVDGGALACAFFLSGILYMNKLIKDMHANISGLERDLKESGWLEIAEPREGAMLIWESREPHKNRQWEPTKLHAGIYDGNDRAVSNGSNTTLMPEEHHFTYNNTRKIIRIWWHTTLDE